MKLIVAIIQDKDKRILIKDLIENDYRVTQLATSGGFLQEGNTTLIIGLDDEKVDHCIKIIERNCHKRTVETSMINYDLEQTFVPTLVEVTVGGAVIFVLDVDQFKTV